MGTARSATFQLPEEVCIFMHLHHFFIRTQIPLNLESVQVSKLVLSGIELGVADDMVFKR